MPARATATTTSKPARSRDLRMGAPRGRELPWGGRGVKIGGLAPPALVPPDPFRRRTPDRGLDRRREARGQLLGLAAPHPRARDALERHAGSPPCAAADAHPHHGGDRRQRPL